LVKVTRSARTNQFVIELRDGLDTSTWALLASRMTICMKRWRLTVAWSEFIEGAETP
jgi:hypothetical protein